MTFAGFELLGIPLTLLPLTHIIASARALAYPPPFTRTLTVSIRQFQFIPLTLVELFEVAPIVPVT
jgi:hypothetical protein